MVKIFDFLSLYWS